MGLWVLTIIVAEGKVIYKSYCAAVTQYGDW